VVTAEALIEQVQEAAREWVQEAIEDTALHLACNLGYETFYDPGAEDWCAGDDDIHHAVREPLSYAAVMADFCKELGVELPELIDSALEDPLVA
jgi:hypothetical protein